MTLEEMRSRNAELNEEIETLDLAIKTRRKIKEMRMELRALRAQQKALQGEMFKLFVAGAPEAEA